LRRAEGRENIFGVFRVKNHDFTPKNHIFPILGGGGARRVRPPAGSAPRTPIQKFINIDHQKLVEILVLILKK
jgi:hypothetical protein